MNVGVGENESAPWFPVRFNYMLYSGAPPTPLPTTGFAHAVFTAWVALAASSRG